MKGRNATKHALLTSAISLLLCFAMLLGTTFAWFTDSVTSSGNVISSGTLDAQMFWALGTEAPDSAQWNDAENSKIFDYSLWEPGYTEARHLKIKNNGTLALKYQLKIIPDGDIGILADVIDVYYSATAKAVVRDDVSSMTKLGTLKDFIKNGVSTTVTGILEAGKEINSTFVLKMQETAGNEYQNKALGAGFDVKLIATQASVDAESDSFGSDYDSNAQYPTSASDVVVLEAPYKSFTLATKDANASTVSGTAALAQKLADAGNQKLMLKVSEPTVNGNTVSFETVALVDENGNEIDLLGNTEALAVKLYVGVSYAGKSVTVYHDGEPVYAGTVDSEGYVSYQTTHFCTVDVNVLQDGESADGIVSDGALDEIVKEDPTKLVEMLVGNHYYTVSAGFASSWSDNKGQVNATVYTPEDLLAYSMMYKNCDLTETGSHSTLTLDRDLDFKGKTWEPIGRFYTDINGNGKTISNLSDSLFGCVYDVQAKDLVLMNVTASGSASGVVAKELAGDIYLTNVVIAGENTVSYVSDSKTNWPEGGTGVGAICGVSLIGGNGSSVNVTVTGTITVNYNDVKFGNTTNLVNLGVSKEFGLNVYEENNDPKVSVADGGKIVTNGSCYFPVADGLYRSVTGISEKVNDYLVCSAEGFAALNAMMQDKSAGRDVTVELLSDIDMSGKTWTPVDSHADTAFSFKSLNGNGHTIFNLKVNGQAMFRRFAGTGDVLICDVCFDGASVESNGSINTSILTGQSYQNVTLDNVDVKNSVISGGYKVAPLIATVYNESPTTVTATLKNCDVVNTTVKASRYDFCTTGMVSFVYADDNDKIVFENCSVKDVVIEAPYDSYKAHATIYTTDSESLYNEAEGVTVDNCTFKSYISGRTVCTGGTLYARNNTYVYASNGYNALTVTGDTTLVIEGNATFRGGIGASGIYVEEGVVLTIVGEGDLKVYGNGKVEYEASGNYCPEGSDDANDGKGGSGIAVANGASVVIDGLSSLVAEGYGVHGFGIGGAGANVSIKNVKSINARGGFLNLTGSYNDAKYNKSEPEGGSAIGGEVVVIENCHIESALGGSKSAGIGNTYHQSTDITVTNTVIDNVVGGASAAAIGGSRVRNNNASSQITKIIITDSTVTAIGGYFGAGIGSGYDTHCQATDIGAKCYLYIRGNSVIDAQGGKYAAGVGGGYHNGNLEGEIEKTVKVTAASGEKFYKDSYTKAQDIGFGVTDPAREGKDNTSSLKYGDTVIGIPAVG